MISARVITVLEDHEPGVIHSKFPRRRRYVEEELLPALAGIGLAASVFPAVTPKTSVVEGGRIHARGFSVKVNVHGCPNNFLSNYILWKECIGSGSTMLVCEDDAWLTGEAPAVVGRALADYDAGEDLGDVLFLLAQSPSVRGKIRQHPDTAMVPAWGSLVRLLFAHDLSCTAAYAVRPKAAAALVAKADRDGHDATDGFVHTAFMQKKVGMLVPADYQKSFMLHEIWEPYCHAPI